MLTNLYKAQMSDGELAIGFGLHKRRIVKKINPGNSAKLILINVNPLYQIDEKLSPHPMRNHAIH